VSGTALHSGISGSDRDHWHSSALRVYRRCQHTEASFQQAHTCSKRASFIAYRRLQTGRSRMMVSWSDRHSKPQPRATVPSSHSTVPSDVQQRGCMFAWIENSSQPTATSNAGKNQHESPGSEYQQRKDLQPRDAFKRIRPSRTCPPGSTRRGRCSLRTFAR
jgi:hypothetical protein